MAGFCYHHPRFSSPAEAPRLSRSQAPRAADRHVARISASRHSGIGSGGGNRTLVGSVHGSDLAANKPPRAQNEGRCSPGRHRRRRRCNGLRFVASCEAVKWGPDSNRRTPRRALPAALRALPPQALPTELPHTEAGLVSHQTPPTFTGISQHVRMVSAASVCPLVRTGCPGYSVPGRSATAICRSAVVLANPPDSVLATNIQLMTP